MSKIAERIIAHLEKRLGPSADFRFNQCFLPGQKKGVLIKGFYKKIDQRKIWFEIGVDEEGYIVMWCPFSKWFPKNEGYKKTLDDVLKKIGLWNNE